ncbi:MAG: hypothetical protein KJ698_01040 [Actinobacteria bacterium]|nr:hypothetical protein [Actinomycetota bacterium]MBU1493378.1 hypothetical protein [Actinomycetota bacterium]
MRFSAAEAVRAAGIDEGRLAAALPRVVPSRVPVWRAGWLLQKLWPEGISAMALPWGIYLAPPLLARPLADLGTLIVHELTHLEQWRRLGPLGWARSYLGDYLSGRRRGLPHHDAYRAIGLEVEARDTARALRPEGPA